LTQFKEFYIKLHQDGKIGDHSVLLYYR